MLTDRTGLSYSVGIRADTGLCVIPRMPTGTNDLATGLTVARTHSTSYLHGKGDPEPWWEVSDQTFLWCEM